MRQLRVPCFQVNMMLEIITPDLKPYVTSTQGPLKK